jgi:uncharacterized protein (TIGR02001 family)
MAHRLLTRCRNPLPSLCNLQQQPDLDMTRRTTLPGTALAVVMASLCVGTALAQTPPAPAPAPAPAAPDNTLTANVGLFSEYIFRGLAQTGGKPAVQGGFDYAHASGFYLGTWASNISCLEDFGAYERSSLEWDFYGGYKNTFPGSEDWNYDVGLLYYYYPGRKVGGVPSANTLELYGAVGWKWLSGKLSYTASKDYFGARPNGQKTQGTIYYDLTATYPFPDTPWSLVGHIGRADVRHDGSGDFKASYTDWKLGVSYVVPDGFVKGLELGAYYTGNNATEFFYTDLTGYDTTKSRVVGYVKKTF